MANVGKFAFFYCAAIGAAQPVKWKCEFKLEMEAVLVSSFKWPRR
jgi:hypothetical protein